MDLLAYMLNAGTPDPASDFWYSAVPGVTPSGMRVDEDGARKLSAWFRARDILATSLAMLPLPVLERLPNDEGADRAPAHPLYRTIHDKPNLWQNAFTWKRQQMYHLIDHGNGLNFIVGGRRGFAEQLRPIDPRLVSAEQVSTGRVVYTVRDPKTSQAQKYTQDEIFHLCGPTDDGFWGKGILAYARESLGNALAIESFGATVFGKGTLSGGALEVPGTLDPVAGKRMAESFVTTAGQWHMPKILDRGVKWIAGPVQLSPQDAQMILAKEHSINDIARWTGVPRHMLDNSDPSFGNAEQFNQNFVTFSLGPWLSLFEFAINDQLIIQNERYYAEFVRDALVRGDIAARWAAYVDAVTTGTYTRNEVRRMENKKALPGLDKPLDPAHLTGKQRQTAQRPNLGGGDEASQSRARLIAKESASRLLRKEVAMLQKEAVRHAASEDDFVVAVTDFYAKHVALVMETLQIERVKAEAYCAKQAWQVVNGEGWVKACETWQTEAYASGLATLAIEDGEA